MREALADEDGAGAAGAPVPPPSGRAAFVAAACAAVGLDGGGEIARAEHAHAADHGPTTLAARAAYAPSPNASQQFVLVCVGFSLCFDQ